MASTDEDSVDAQSLYLAAADEDDLEEIIDGDAVEQVDAAIADLARDQQTEGPALKDWKDVALDFVEVSLGQASNDVWEQAKQEVACARHSFVKFFVTPNPTIEQLVLFFLGPESELYRVVKDELGWSFKEWSRFIKTFCVQSLYKVSVTNLFAGDSYIETKHLMAEAEYVERWRALGTALLPADERAAPASLETLWMKAEAATNSMFRRLVVEPWINPDDAKRLESVEIVYDDNKMWHDARSSDAYLNMVQHVRDNRRGPVHHDAVASATGLVAGFRFERKKDTSITTMKAITRQQFVPAQGGTQLRDLGWLFGKGDRAYTTKEGLFQFLLPSGAKARGTKKRSKEWPQSYGITLKADDERTDIPTYGAKTMYVKSVDVADRKLYAIAYRNGNGGVTLGATTEAEDVYHWDLTLQNPADRKWFFDLSEGKISKSEWLRRCFRPLGAKSKTDVITETFVSLLADQPMHPLTMGQSKDHSWWVCRMFSQSSTSTDKAFAVYDGSEAELGKRESWSIAKAYLSKSGARSWNTAVKNEETGQQEVTSEETKADDTADGNNDGPTDRDIAVIDAARLKSDDTYANLLAAALDPDSEDEDRHFVWDEAIERALVAEGASLSKNANDMRRQMNNAKKMRDWCTQHRFLRPYYFKKQANALKQLADRLFPPCVIGDAVTTPTAIFNAIKVHLELHPNTELQTNSEAPPTMDLLSKRQKLLHAMLSASFLKKQSGDSRDYTRRGLDLEHAFARKLVEDSNHGRTAGFKVHEIATVPVVERTGVGHRSAVASTDFAATVEIPGTRAMELVLVEMKARVKDGTAQKEQIIQGVAKLRCAGNSLFDRNQRYFCIKAEDPNFSHFVGARKEALQILHHAYVYNVNWVLLLIGDNHGRIIVGIWVEFDTTLKSAWGDVLKDIYGLSIAFLYNNLHETSFVLSDEQASIVEPVLCLIRVAGGELDLLSFRQMVMIWRVIRLRWPKPLPPSSKLLPFIFSSWNAAKGGSDTITKLLWSSKSEPPNKLPQAHAIARILHMIFVQIHRCNHISTSKLALNYKSLQHFRNAGNKRSSLHKSLIEISHSFDSAIGVDAETEAPQTPQRIPPSPEGEAPALIGRSLRGVKPKLSITASALPVTGSTPQRTVKKKLDRLLDGSLAPKQNQHLVADRVKKCIGIPVFVKTRALCIICSKETNWYCIGCHAYLCMTNVCKAKNSDQFDCFEMDLTIPALVNSGASEKRFELANKCFLHHHRAAIFKAIGATASNGSR